MVFLILSSYKRVGINSGPEDRGPKGNTKSQNTDSFITTLHYRRLCCIVVQVSNTTSVFETLICILTVSFK